MIIHMLFFLIAFTLTVKTLEIAFFIKCPAMNVAKFNVHIGNAFRADHNGKCKLYNFILHQTLLEW